MSVSNSEMNTESKEPKENGCIMSKWSNWSECKQGNSCDENYQVRVKRVIKNAENSKLKCSIIREKRKCFLSNCA